MPRTTKKRNVDAAVWLAVLLDAQAKPDAATAKLARAELRRIGVKVSLATGRRGPAERAGHE